MEDLRDAMEYFSCPDNIHSMETLLLVISMMSFGGFVALKISHYI